MRHNVGGSTTTSVAVAAGRGVGAAMAPEAAAAVAVVVAAEALMVQEAVRGAAADPCAGRQRTMTSPSRRRRGLDTLRPGTPLW
jgi:hypothetical protein